MSHLCEWLMWFVVGPINSRSMMKPMQASHQLLDNSPIRFWFAGIFGGVLFVSALFGRFYKQNSYKGAATDARWEKVAYLCISGGMFVWGFWHIFKP
jgi:uncharacterized membrane protein